MFHKAKTEAERQKIFDEYLLGILKKKKVINTNKKIIDESGFSFDPDADNKQLKGAFNNYVDTLVIKNYMIEQLQTRLKISKSLSTQFVNKLNGNQVLILSKNLNDFIKYLLSLGFSLGFMKHLYNIHIYLIYMKLIFF